VGFGGGVNPEIGFGESCAVDPNIVLYPNFADRVCPHRGVGEENTYIGIKIAVERRPFMVEFDGALSEDELYLGHPPIMSNTTVSEALDLYVGSPTIPKIDVKLKVDNYKKSLAVLVSLLATKSLPKVLINVGGDVGDLSAKQYMEAEAFLLAHAGNNILLNVDLARYSGASSAEIREHLSHLPRPPFSVSPNMEADLEGALEIAHRYGIPHIHFWADHHRQYELSTLDTTMRSVLDQGFQVYFDIQEHNIAPDALDLAA
jgi:hypothetical protein